MPAYFCAEQPAVKLGVGPVVGGGQGAGDGGVNVGGGVERGGVGSGGSHFRMPPGAGVAMAP